MAELKKPDFIIVPTILLDDERLDRIDALVYGVIYWYKKLRNERCIASNNSIAQILKSTAGTVANSISRLNKYGYVEVRLTDTRHREEIIPLIMFAKMPEDSSIDEGGIHPRIRGGFIPGLRGDYSVDEQNNNSNNKNKNNNISPTPHNPKNSMGTEHNQAAKISDCSTPEINPKSDWDSFFDFFSEASGQRPLKTMGRQSKFLTRRKVFSLDQMKLAVEHCFQDNFYSGQNDRGWKADIDYVLRNDEVLDRLLQLKPRKESSISYEE